jgi:hypothetical protein
VPTEDYLAPEVLPKEIKPVNLLEVLGQQFRRDSFHLAIAVRGVPSGVECVLVHIGGVDLDPLPELVQPELLGQDHGKGVGLFPRSTADAPGPDRLTGGLGCQEFRESDGTHHLPRGRVAEETGNVDEDGIEESGKLVRMDLEILLVSRKSLHSNRLHALTYTAGQRSGLVTMKIETARGKQVLQEPGPLGIGFRWRRGKHRVVGSTITGLDESLLGRVRMPLAHPTTKASAASPLRTPRSRAVRMTEAWCSASMACSVKEEALWE